MLSVIATALALAACASGPELGPDDTIVKQDELSSLRAAAARVPDLERRIGDLEGQLARLEAERAALAERLLVLDQRAGRAPFETQELTSVDVAGSYIDALRVESPGARPRKASLGKALKGRGTVVAFWATWCKPCIAEEELALLRELRTALEREGIGFASVAIDGVEKVQAHPRTDRFLYPLWQRDQAPFYMLPEAFIRERGVDMPLFLVMSPTGRIRWYRAGQLNPTAVRDMITAAMLTARG
ncbi:MAG: redoxin domain-containing protein [Deltaproteobacteria bacterium]|nr:MAG: redoxin domain-containing protein [Deltaproteobacteria bacterium]